MFVRMLDQRSAERGQGREVDAPVPWSSSSAPRYPCRSSC